jgi:hypothetical protein
MHCGYKEKAILYFYGELPGGTGEFEAHLAGCPVCAEELAVLKGLSSGFSAFKPGAPVLDAVELARAARGVPLAERFMSGVKSLAFSGAAAAVFLFAFQAITPKGDGGGAGELDARLDSVEYGIYSLHDDMLYFTRADLDYSYADMETQKEGIL